MQSTLAGDGRVDNQRTIRSIQWKGMEGEKVDQLARYLRLLLSGNDLIIFNATIISRQCWSYV